MLSWRFHRLHNIIISIAASRLLSQEKCSLIHNTASWGWSGVDPFPRAKHERVERTKVSG